MVRGIGRAIGGVLAILIGCARTAVELDDVGGDGDAAGDDGGKGGSGGASGGRSGSPPTDDDDILGGTSAGGVSPTGGIGGSFGGQAMGGRGGAPTGGMAGNAGSPEPPFDPGGPIPNCRSDSPAIVPLKDNHWLYLVARLDEQTPEGRYLVELTPGGPRNVTLLSEAGGFRGWSFDGRFMAFTRSATSPYVIEVLDFSRGDLPVPVPVFPRSGDLTWSPSDGRYALKYSESSAGSNRLAIVDATTNTENVIDIPFVDQNASWSGDGRYVALFGPYGVSLVDTMGPGLAYHSVHDDGSAGLVWSPDSRYVAFRSYHPEDRTERLYLFDTQSRTLVSLDEAVDGQRIGSVSWAGNSWLIQHFAGRASFFDLEATPRAPVALADYTLVPTSLGVVSPGGKCFAFVGRCEAANEDGVCVRTLPPDPKKPAILLQRPGDDRPHPFWAGTGDQLLLMTGTEPFLIDVELDGGDYTSQSVTADTRVVGVSAPMWNPSGDSDWIKYSATESSGTERKFQPRLWRRETGDTYGFVIGNGVARSFAWSADGRYLVFEFEFGESSSVYFAQELIDRELGASWTLDAPIPSGSMLWPSYLQP